METPGTGTKEIMAHSQLKINNPDFTKLIVEKIRRRQRSRLILTHIFLYLLIVSVVTVIFITGADNPDSPAVVISERLVQTGTWLLNNEFIILPFLILFIIKVLIGIFRHKPIN